MLRYAKSLMSMFLLTTVLIASERGLLATPFTHPCEILDCDLGFQCTDWFTCTGCPQTENWCENVFEPGCELFCASGDKGDMAEPSFCGSGAVYCVCTGSSCIED
jgi:hypothetical protein